MLSSPDATMHTFTALLLAHVLADFIFQTNKMVERKNQPLVLLLHGGVVFLVSIAALGGSVSLALSIAVAHLIIDAMKTWTSSLKQGYVGTVFIVDQAAHIATITIAALWFPDAAASGLWGPWLDTIIIPVLIMTGFIIVVYAGGPVVGLVTAPYVGAVEGQGLPQAGKTIGQLERVLIFLLIMINQPAGIGFLIAAKSFLRFEATKEQEASEYVIIGTLTSFGWALAISSGTFALVDIATQLSKG